MSAKKHIEMLDRAKKILEVSDKFHRYYVARYDTAKSPQEWAELLLLLVEQMQDLHSEFIRLRGRILDIDELEARRSKEALGDLISSVIRNQQRKRPDKAVTE